MLYLIKNLYVFNRTQRITSDFDLEVKRLLESQ